MRQKGLLRRLALLLLPLSGLCALLQVLRAHSEAARQIAEHGAWYAPTASAARGGGSGGGALAAPTPPRPLRPGVLHLLFMASGSLPHAAIWRRFLEGAPRSAFRVWAHCTGAEACRRAQLGSALPGLRLVSTVRSERCTDLVSPQAWLMKAALAKGPGAAVPEKFVLLSDTTLPIKPFAVVHRALLATRESDMCLQTPRRWRRTSVDGVDMLLVKHSQWVVLSRAHAARFARDWTPVDSGDMWSLPLRGRRWEGRRERVFVDRKNDRCADEFAVFATLFGLFAEGGGRRAGACPLNASASCPSAPLLYAESRCRTLDFFREQGWLQDALRSDPEFRMVFRGAGHPAEFTRLGARSLWALRGAPHLFARKFARGAQLGNFSAVMFSPPDEGTAAPPAAPAPTQAAAAGLALLWGALPRGLVAPGALAARAPDASGGTAVAAARPTRPAARPPGVLHLLFLLRGDSLPHAGLWQRFFAEAPAGAWAAWVHCQKPRACDRSNVTGQMPGLRRVRSVRAQPCRDMVSAEAQLMRAALGAPPAPGARGGTAKFVLLDDAAIPAKPFGAVLAALTSSPESDFCLRPAGEWGATSVDGVRLELLKHSQWVVLSREHAECFARGWTPVSKEAEWTIRLRGRRRVGGPDRVFVGLGPEGDRCADEFAVFATLFGLRRDGEEAAPCPLNRSARCASRPELAAQSRCRTLDASKGSPEDSWAAAVAELRADPESDVRGTAARGAGSLELARLGPAALRALRASPFLFARPVRAGAVPRGSEELLFAA